MTQKLTIDKEQEILVKIYQLINGAVAESVLEENNEKNGGKQMRDNPKARLIRPPVIASGNNVTFGDSFDIFVGGREVLKLFLPGRKRARNYGIFLDVTTYLTSRRMWKAYPKAIELLKSYDITEEVLYPVFHYLPGVAAVVVRGTKVLVGIRATNLAGTHTGMMSVPAGLMEPEEGVTDACLRELKEETEIVPASVGKIIATHNPDAPNTTFVHSLLTKQAEVRETYEAKGKKFIWVEIADLRAGIAGDTFALANAFRHEGIDVSDLQIAPDILQGLRVIFG